MIVETHTFNKTEQAFLKENALKYVLSNPDLIQKVLSKHAKPLQSYGLTKRQRELLLFIKAYQEEHDITPSYQEMMEAVGLKSKSGVSKLVHALKERGMIWFLHNRARSIVVRAFT